MQRYKARLAFDGTNYAGFQVQDNANTVQEEIEKALKTIAKNQFVRIHGAGRTDAGVHALGQVIHFDFPFDIPSLGIQKGLNTLLPDDIVVEWVELADPDFHSRYLAKEKTYEYRILNQKNKDPFLRNLTYHHPYPMDFKACEEALGALVGEHDFTSFTASNTDKENKVRTIYQASVHVEEHSKQWVFTFRANGFLYNMIRIIMGTLVEIADGRRPASDMKTILQAKDRQLAGPTLSAKGLYMVEITY